MALCVRNLVAAMLRSKLSDIHYGTYQSADGRPGLSVASRYILFARSPRGVQAYFYNFNQSHGVTKTVMNHRGEPNWPNLLECVHYLMIADELPQAEDAVKALPEWKELLEVNKRLSQN